MANIAKSAIGLMILTIIGKVLGFLREMVLASTYGASAYTDAYLVAYNIPSTVFILIATALGTTFIPMYFEIDKNKGKLESLKFTNNVINIVVILAGILIIFGLIFTEPLVKLFALGFKGETLAITIKFTKIMLFGILCIGISDRLVAYFETQYIFIAKGLIGIPFNIVIIISILLSIKLGPEFIAYGTLIAMFTQVIVQIPFLKKKGFRYIPYINLNDEYLKKMIKLVIPVMIGVGAVQINTLIDRTLASTLVEGSISALTYSNRLYGFIMALFVVSITTVIYPILSKISLENSKSEFKNIVIKSINSVIIIILPISVGAIILATPIIRILFERGNFDSVDTKMTSIALVCYSIGMLGFALRDVLKNIFYSIKDTKTPMVNGIIGVLINIALNLILIKPMGHAGLAFATSISATVTSFLLLIKLNSKFKINNEIIPILFKCLVSAGIMGCISKFAYLKSINLFGGGLLEQLLAVTISILIGALIYFALIMILRVKEAKELVSIIIGKIKKN